MPNAPGGSLSSGRGVGMPRRRQAAALTDEPPPELRPEHWEHWADRADLGDDPIMYRARAVRRQGDALEQWARDAGMPWTEACRRAGRA